MTYLIGLLLLALIGCAVTIYRLSGENRDLTSLLDEVQVDNYYLRERNKALNAELLMRDIVTTTASTAYREDGENRSIVMFPPETKTLPAEHPQKRKQKSIRGKRK